MLGACRRSLGHLARHRRAAFQAAARGGSALPDAASPAAVAVHQRSLSSTPQAAAAGSPPGASPPGEPEMLEVREYTLKPEGMKDFLRLTGEHAELRSKLLPFLGMFTCDTGGALNRVVHFYNYKDLDERDAARAGTAASEKWQEEYLARSRLTVSHQTSHIMVPCLPVLQAAAAVQPSAFESPARPPPGAPPAVYEMRSYQLQHGWGAVPAVVDAFTRGLPAKISADPEAAGQLVFFGSTCVGSSNSLLEVWRYPSAQASMRARYAARAVPEWRAAVNEVADVTLAFDQSILHPTPFSPWQ